MRGECDFKAVCLPAAIPCSEIILRRRGTQSFRLNQKNRLEASSLISVHSDLQRFRDFVVHTSVKGEDPCPERSRKYFFTAISSLHPCRMCNSSSVSNERAGSPRNDCNFALLRVEVSERRLRKPYCFSDDVTCVPSPSPLRRVSPCGSLQTHTSDPSSVELLMA